MTGQKHTPLTKTHEALGAKMVPFAGYLMPVAYGSIIEEHHAVRQRVGLFDVSHMGEFSITGPGAVEFVNRVITNDCSRVEPGGLQYSVMCRENGTVVDDLLVFILSETDVLLVVNAANIEKDFAHVTAHDHAGIEVRNVSDEFALIAVQGPSAPRALRACQWFEAVHDRIEDTAYYKGFRFGRGDDTILVSRTGYTGELGFEIFVPPHLAEEVWNELSRAGQEFGIAPIGLGARDTLRFEAAYCLYGHELDDDTSPLESGLGWVVKLAKERFTGKDALKEERARGPKRHLIGLAPAGRNIARQGHAVVADGAEVGRVTSGTFSPTLQRSLCMAHVASGHENDSELKISIRGKEIPTQPAPLPFYRSRAK